MRKTAIGLICVLVVMGLASSVNAQRGWAPRQDGQTHRVGGGSSVPMWLAVGPVYGSSNYTYNEDGINLKSKPTVYGLQFESFGRVAQFELDDTRFIAIDGKFAITFFGIQDNDDSDSYDFDGGRIVAQVIPVARLPLKVSNFGISPYLGYGIGFAFTLDMAEDFVFVRGPRLGCDIMISESFGLGLSYQRSSMRVRVLTEWEDPYGYMDHGQVELEESISGLSLEFIFGL